MTRADMIEKLTALRAHCAYISWGDKRQAAREEFDAVLAALHSSPVGAEPTDLVALVQEWQAAIRAPGYRGDSDEVKAANMATFRREALATAALRAWTPAQAEPAAPLTVRSGKIGGAGDALERPAGPSADDSDGSRDDA